MKISRSWGAIQTNSEDNVKKHHENKIKYTALTAEVEDQHTSQVDRTDLAQPYQGKL